MKEAEGNSSIRLPQQALAAALVRTESRENFQNASDQGGAAENDEGDAAVKSEKYLFSPGKFSDAGSDLCSPGKFSDTGDETKKTKNDTKKKVTT